MAQPNPPAAPQQQAAAAPAPQVQGGGPGLAAVLNAQNQQNQNYRIHKEQKQWADDEKAKMEFCEGLTQRSVREWLRKIHNAFILLPAGFDANWCIKRLMTLTARGDLQEELENFIAIQPNQANIAHQALTNHISHAFLGPDEAETLKSEVKCMKQGVREQIPAFNRRFTKIADLAFPALGRAADVEADLAGYYLNALQDGPIKDALFKHRPRLATLAAVKQAAAAEYTELRYQQRITGKPVQQEEAMEIAAIAQPLRELLAEYKQEVADLKKQIASLKRAQQPPPRQSFQQQGKKPPRKPDGSPGDCFYCGKPNHIARECRKKKSDQRNGRLQSHPKHEPAGEVLTTEKTGNQ